MAMSARWSHRIAYLEAAFTATGIWLALRLAHPSRVIAYTARRSRQNGATRDDARVAPLAGIVNAAVTRFLGADQCLVRSLTLQELLSRRAIAADLRIGVRREGDALRAHAWVEIDNRPVNDSAIVVEQYAAFPGPLLGWPPFPTDRR